MSFEEIIRKRTAVRKFSDKKLEKEKLDKILEAGRLAPTAKNSQPIKIYVIKSEEGISNLDKATRCRYGASTVLIVCGNKEEAYHNLIQEFTDVMIDLNQLARMMNWDEETFKPYKMKALDDINRRYDEAKIRKNLKAFREGKFNTNAKG